MKIPPYSDVLEARAIHKDASLKRFHEILEEICESELKGIPNACFFWPREYALVAEAVERLRANGWPAKIIRRQLQCSDRAERWTENGYGIAIQ
jgi:hypothetical protein